MNESLTYIDEVFDRQYLSYKYYGQLNYKARRQKLLLLKNGLSKFQDKLIQAINKDFGKGETETKITELFPLHTEIKRYRRNLRHWMQPDIRDNSLLYLGTKSKVEYQSKGVCLILAPWNYPILLTLGPLIAAIAAGNTAIIKPSERTHHTTVVIQELIRDTFPNDYVDVVMGDVEVSKYLLNKAFHHIFFTGSPEVGKKVMMAASEHLASLTLELGGKSPAIVAKNANIENAARRIIWGKGINSGQTCIAPDYVLVHSKIKEKLVKKLKEQVELMFSRKEDYAGIISDAHFNHLKAIYHIANADRSRFPIHVIEDPEAYPALAEKEIFGPLLPIYTYDQIDDVITRINNDYRPLAIYYFGKNDSDCKQVYRETRSGGFVINHTLIHFSQTNLPFGGVNHSGMGRYHGRDGFIEFSNQRSVLKQQWGWSIASLIFPPYNKWKKSLVELLIKYF